MEFSGKYTFGWTFKSIKDQGLLVFGVVPLGSSVLWALLLNYDETNLEQYMIQNNKLHSNKVDDDCTVPATACQAFDFRTKNPGQSVSSRFCRKSSFNCLHEFSKRLMLWISLRVTGNVWIRSVFHHFRLSRVKLLKWTPLEPLVRAYIHLSDSHWREDKFAAKNFHSV